ncbi:hypothetical protein [Halorhodospira halochloris]|uniref:hypothetical protein n=1 Tax=Halorhodospira halochloris TaxID=1052 RepID=UPI00076F801B|nr:hypothetical protein [Halorhodospira halochloris]MBK1651879.1 hypothetical protein [Halorhodospira halochloris]
MTQIKGPGFSAYIVPAAVEEMAQVLLSAFASEDSDVLRAAVGAREGQPLQEALEDWLLLQLDLEDQAVAQILFRLFVDRLQRRVEVLT